MILISSVILLAESNPDQHSIENLERERGFFGDMFNSGMDKYNDFRQVINGPDGRCGFRRGTYCMKKLTTLFAGCSAMLAGPLHTISGGISYVMSASSCLGTATVPYSMLKYCRECIRDGCEAAMAPMGKDQYCDEMKRYIEEKIL